MIKSGMSTNFPSSSHLIRIIKHIYLILVSIGFFQFLEEVKYLDWIACEGKRC